MLKSDSNFYDKSSVKVMIDVQKMLERIQSFFCTNGINQEVGEKLIKNFLKLTFSGHSSLSMENYGQDYQSDLELPEVQSWLEKRVPLTTRISKEYASLIRNVYSDEDRCSLKIGRFLNDTFLDIVLNRKKFDADINFEGSIGVLACLSTIWPDGELQTLSSILNLPNAKRTTH